MKKTILFLLFVLSNALFAQDKSKEEIKEIFWGKNDPYNSVNSIPEKWKNESAVIICKSENHDYHNYRVNVTYTSEIRKKIMLLDEAAVKEFSEFSFLDKIYSEKGFGGNKGRSVFGAKIIKPNGNVIEIDVDKETKLVDNENKLAIRNLEVGDIIDFYLYAEEKFKTWQNVGFPKVERVLGDVYPIVNYRLTFLSENDFFINFNSYNGAPQLEEVKADLSSDRKFQFVANDIEKQDFPRWFYPLVELPCYKFQVYFAKSAYDKGVADAFLSKEEKIIKKDVSQEELLEFFKFKYVLDKFYDDVPHQDPKRLQKGEVYNDDEARVRSLYYYCRFLYMTKSMEREISYENKLINQRDYMLGYYVIPFYDTREFMAYYVRFLKDNKIDYDIIIGTSRDNGPIKDLLIRDNLTTVLRVNTPHPLYIEYANPFSGVDLLNPELENSKAYALKSFKSNPLNQIKEISLPSSSVNDNVSKAISNISLTNNISEFKVNRESSFFGHLKMDEQKNKIPFYEYLKEDEALNKLPEKYDKPRSKEKLEIEEKGMDALISKLKESNKEKYIKSISNEYDSKVIDYSLEVIKSGRYGVNEPFVYKEEFKITNNFIKKAGDNYIIEIGKFLTAQVEIDKNEKERKNNIYMSYPKSFENEIIFEIPAGYSVSGIEKLNKNFVNETGQFVSEASIAANKLTIKTSKQYKNYYEPNSNWNKMIQFLDAAYQFTQEKILLKKI